MLIELREYTVRPGKRDAWVTLFEGELIPYHVANGVTVLGSWIVEDEENTFVWMRGYEDEADRAKKAAAMTESDYWKNDLVPRIEELVERDKHRVKRLLATPTSPIR